VLAWRTGPGAAHTSLPGDHALRWIGPAEGGGLPRGGVPLPLVTLDAPRRMRSAAIAALDGAGTPWRVVHPGPSLAGGPPWQPAWA